MENARKNEQKAIQWIRIEGTKYAYAGVGLNERQMMHLYLIEKTNPE